MSFCICSCVVPNRFYRFSNDITQAVFEFNKSRRDSRWGEASLIQLIELYLNPEQEIKIIANLRLSSCANLFHFQDAVWEQTQDTADSDSNIEVLRRLLQELTPLSTDSRKLQILEGYGFLMGIRTGRFMKQLYVSYCWMATRSQANIVRASEMFFSVYENDKGMANTVEGQWQHIVHNAQNTCQGYLLWQQC